MAPTAAKKVVRGTSLLCFAPTAKDKGKIMKNLMPKVKGKADGKLVNEIVSAFMN